MPHNLELFVGGCPLCDGFREQIGIGECGPCRLHVIGAGHPTPAQRRKMDRYGIRVRPTLIIDAKVKLEGPPTEFWLCSEDFYDELARKYPLRPPARRGLPLPVKREH